jgi:hypothetical protein
MAEPIQIHYLTTGTFSWELHLDNEEETTIASVCGGPLPRRGDHVSHEDFDKPLKVTRVVWDIRRGYGLQADVYVDPLV